MFPAITPEQVRYINQAILERGFGIIVGATVGEVTPVYTVGMTRSGLPEIYTDVNYDVIIAAEIIERVAGHWLSQGCSLGQIDPEVSHWDMTAVAIEYDLHAAQAMELLPVWVNVHESTVQVVQLIHIPQKPAELPDLGRGTFYSGYKAPIQRLTPRLLH